MLWVLGKKPRQHRAQSRARRLARAAWLRPRRSHVPDELQRETLLRRAGTQKSQTLRCWMDPGSAAHRRTGRCFASPGRRCAASGARDRSVSTHLCPSRHCERSEAIRTIFAARLWIASLRSQ
ncbi:hypothetical protein DAA53_16770 [Bradyrhizobium sp. WBAH23]|nr:hypothetical protein DAA53_16770 [Bradyrhizobium sp. WBAH23]